MQCAKKKATIFVSKEIQKSITIAINLMGKNNNQQLTSGMANFVAVDSERQCKQREKQLF